MLRGLKSFYNEYPMSKTYLIYGGIRRMREGNIEIIPMIDALRTLPDILS